MPQPLRQEAEHILELVKRDPRGALAAATDLLGRGDVPAEPRAVAERAAALAELELGRVGAARKRFERARDQAITDGLVARAAEIQIGLAMVLLQCEEPMAALREVDAALTIAPDQGTRGKVLSQRATILMRLGRQAEALQVSDTALRCCREAGLGDSVARLLSNRGVVHAYLGDYNTAEGELREALTLLRQQGSELTAAQVLHNLGFVEARRGDVPAALAYFDATFEEYRRLDLSADVVFTDLCEVLIAARLLPEARKAAEEAVSGLALAGLAADLAEARLMLAEVALAEGDTVVARSEAAAASSALARQGRAGWAALAGFVAARATWAEHSERSEPAEIVPVAERLAGELEAGGWRMQALEARIAGARAAITMGDSARAMAMLSTARSHLTSGSSAERSRAWYAIGLARLAAGERDRALRALRASLWIAEQHRAAFGATELRARAAIGSAEPADLGLELVLGSGDAARILDWSERRRARSLWSPSVVPPADPELAERLAELRHTVASLEQATEAGELTQALEDRRRLLETQIRHRSLHAARDKTSAATTALSISQLREHLSRRILVELVELHGQLHAVACTERSCVVRSLGPIGAVAREGAALRFAMGRLARGRGSEASLLAAAGLIRRAAVAADALVFGPLRADLEAADFDEMVLVPTGALHAMPWGVLPTLTGRALSVAPSAALWLSRVRAAPPCTIGPVVLVAGPGVAGAKREVELVERHYRGCSVVTVLSGSEATAREVTSAARAANVLHVVAHGRFRSDNAMFSALDLADGPLTVYDLELLGEPPELVVLSACDAGRSDIQPGDELMGTTAAMLALGTTAIVASVVPVADARTPEVMEEFHRRLLQIGHPAEALAKTQAANAICAIDVGEMALRTDRALDALAASAFVCFGAGAKQSPAPTPRAVRRDRVAANISM